MRAAVLLLLALVACDSGPPFTYELHLGGDDSFTVTADGEAVTPDPNGTFVIVRQFDSFGDAVDADPIHVRAERNGAVTWEYDYEPGTCADHMYSSNCGDYVRSLLTTRLEVDGGVCGLCESLSCYDDGGWCGGWISGPPPQ